MACEMERVLEENESGAETVAEVRAPVPLPVRRPPRVVEPVPPKVVEMVEEAETTPLMACSGPVREPTVREPPETVRPPENERLVEVALDGKGYEKDVRFRVPPKESVPPPERPPEVLMVTEEFWSWLLPMVEVATTEPLALTERRVLARRVMAREVVVALVVVELPWTVRVPTLAVCAKRLVEEAVVEKKLVEVALVVVPMVTVRAEMVEVAYAVNPPLNCVRVEVALPASWKGYWARSEEVETLLLKVVQSAEVRRPRAEPEAEGTLRVAVPPKETGEEAQPMSEPEVPSEKEMLEFWSWLLPMVEVATTAPEALTERRVLEREVMAREVEVAEVVAVAVGDDNEGDDNDHDGRNQNQNSHPLVVRP